MRKSTKIITIILLALLLRGGWFVYENWNTFEAIIYSLTTTQEDVLRDLERTKRELQDFIDKEENIEVRDLTEEEMKALTEGEMTEEEIIERLTGQVSEPEQSQKPQPNKPSSTQKPAEKPVSESERKISELIAKLYVQKGIYLGKLDDIEAKVRAEYLATPNKWGKKKDAKKVLLNKYLPTVAEWEKTCDSVVYGILDEIRVELDKSGKDQAIVNTMKKAYLEEKKLKKSYFINRYMD